MSDTEIAAVKTELREVSHMRVSRLDDSLYSKELAPHYMKLATQLASSELIPKSFRGKPQDLFICWAMGYQVGLTPEQSQQCIAVINGKPCMWGDDMLALCMTHKDFEDIIEEPILKDAVVVGYSCTIKRVGRSDRINIFTMDDAKKAGLLGKVGPWTQYPSRMLKLRARGFSLRDAFPDALKGIKPREEVEDYIDAEYKVVDDSKLSRTELLKKDYLTKTGKPHAEPNNIPDEDNVHPVVTETPEESDQSEDLGDSGEKTTPSHSEIKRLCAQKGFSQERLAKALEFYEADSIESLNDDALIHFYNKLLEL